MGNEGEIRAGMKFGTYDATINKWGDSYKYNVVHNYSNGEESVTYKYLGTNNVFAHAFRSYTGGGKYYDYAGIHVGSYTFSIMEINKGDGLLNVFDTIEGRHQHAVDLNHNHKVDPDEIFEGEFDNEAYTRAKEDGKLSNYTKYKKM